MEKYFICPHCHKKQTSVIEWETESVAYKVDFKTKDLEEVDKITGDFENFTCVECGEDFDIKTQNKIRKLLGW